MSSWNIKLPRGVGRVSTRTLGHAMTISTGKRWLVLLAFFIASWPCVIFAETSAQVNILKFQLTAISFNAERRCWKFTRIPA